MLSYILNRAQQFERDFGVAPGVVYINPQHFEAMFHEAPGLFGPELSQRLGFRIVILPSSRLSHPEAALLMPGGDVAGSTPVSTAPEDCCDAA